MTQASGIFANVNWGVPSWDLFIVLFFVVSVFVYGLSLGRERIMVILASIYMAYAVSSNLPFITEKMSQKFNLGPVFVMRTVVFLVILVALFFLFSRMNIFNNLGGGTSLPVVALFSVLHVGLFVTIIFSFIPPTALAGLSSTTRMVFGSEIGKFLWIIAPIGAMYLMKGDDPNASDR
ncbi:hypothetical protein KKC60_03125 [Patescibacteria group bacterium]|nr:hypothetical protein [Patescibacteria group bacterium]